MVLDLAREFGDDESIFFYVIEREPWINPGDRYP